VLNEILALERQGLEIQIFSLMRPSDPCRHEAMDRLAARVSYPPGWKRIDAYVKAHARLAAGRPGAYFGTLLKVVGTGKVQLLWRWIQAAVIADQVIDDKPDRLHAHFAARATNVAALVSRLTGVAYSFTAHAFDIYKTNVDPDVLKLKLDEADFVVTISEFNKRHLGRLANGSASRVRLIRNGIDLSQFRATNARKETPFTVLCVARLVEKKGHKYLIEAASILQDRSIDVRFRIAGAGILAPELRRQVDALGIQDRVQFLGSMSQNQLLDLYQTSHLYVLPSVVGSDGNREGLPVSIVEALASGLPVISTLLAGIPEVVRDGENGFLVPARDSLSLADAIERLATDRQCYERLQSNTRRSVIEDYDLDKTSRGMFDLLVGPPAMGATR
jgi:glycosyltransferase involved in cell wall biosynthesis